MKEVLIKSMEEMKQTILQRLKNEEEILDPDEVDKLLDSLLEIDKILKKLREE